MNNENVLKRRLEDAQRIEKYLMRNNAPKTKISEIRRLKNHIDTELNKERVINTLTELYTPKK